MRSALARRGGREDARAEMARELDRRLADAAAAGQDEDDVAVAQPGARDEHVPGGEEGQRKRGGGDEVEVRRNGDEVLGGHRDELGVAAVGLQSEHVVLRRTDCRGPRRRRRSAPQRRPGCSITRCPAGSSPPPAIDDLAGDVAAGDVRQRQL